MRHFLGSTQVPDDKHTLLEYYIQETDGSYGIEIHSRQAGHTGFAFCGGVTQSRDEIMTFAQCLMEHSAYPENLGDYVEDYLYEKRNNELMGSAVGFG